MEDVERKSTTPILAPAERADIENLDLADSTSVDQFYLLKKKSLSPARPTGTVPPFAMDATSAAGNIDRSHQVSRADTTSFDQSRFVDGYGTKFQFTEGGLYPGRASSSGISGKIAEDVVRKYEEIRSGKSGEE